MAPRSWRRLSPKCARLTGHRHRRIYFYCAHPLLKGRCAHLTCVTRILGNFVCAHFGEIVITKHLFLSTYSDAFFGTLATSHGDNAIKWSGANHKQLFFFGMIVHLVLISKGYLSTIIFFIFFYILIIESVNYRYRIIINDNFRMDWQ